MNGQSVSLEPQPTHHNIKTTTSYCCYL